MSVKRYIEVRGVHLGVLPQWRWRLFRSSTCHYRVWAQWACFEFAVERAAARQAPVGEAPQG